MVKKEPMPRIQGFTRAILRSVGNVHAYNPEQRTAFLVTKNMVNRAHRIKRTQHQKQEFDRALDNSMKQYNDWVKSAFQTRRVKDANGNLVKSKSSATRDSQAKHLQERVRQEYGQFGREMPNYDGRFRVSNLRAERNSTLATEIKDGTRNLQEGKKQARERREADAKAARKAHKLAKRKQKEEANKDFQRILRSAGK